VGAREGGGRKREREREVGWERLGGGGREREASILKSPLYSKRLGWERLGGGGKKREASLLKSPLYIDRWNGPFLTSPKDCTYLILPQVFPNRSFWFHFPYYR
jgi:hypothetical protein